ncbi:TIGR03620 family F420-dependent LLM class oxidoreductase [Nocardia cyriacigeorgica]|uniref:TIGR03620 family F420-dependent LLM class oxidoreductase n=1 Tax=Nocardia cyriacigeorgica TaxID=135487 RepID=UPI0024571AE1|nr:TIGR03620 family F420-dependent LLM class oxidoreductase [Nocardia cyriacigeorgica]
MTDRQLGPLGIWTFAFENQSAGRVREAAAELEDIGYGAVWFGEAMGRDAVGQAWLLLSATERMVVASGIANIAFRDPIAMATAERTLGEAFPGRFVLGLGGQRVGGQTGVLDGYPMPPIGAKPLTAVREYLNAMDAVPKHGPVPDPAPRRMLAALGPKMLELAAERTWGAHPYFVPVEHTELARRTIGPDSTLAVEQAVVLDTDRSRAREVARAHVAGYVTTAPHQQANIRRFGYGDADIVGGPSDRLVDAIVAYGDLDAIDRRIRAHLDAGADHVCLQVLTAEPGMLPLPQWRELAGLIPVGAA